MRLAVAMRLMSCAQSLSEVVAAKDKAKAAGLTKRDTEKLKTSFETHVARFRATQMKEQEHEQR